jgi:hypothetical protein
MVKTIIGLPCSKYSIPGAEQRLDVGFFSNLVQSVVHKEAAVLPKAAKTKTNQV